MREGDRESGGGREMKDYERKNVALARTLRKNMTPEEKHLWYDYLCSYSDRFQRQKPIGNYIADFYCAKARLVVELDGSGHYIKGQPEYDKERTEYMKTLGIEVIRFTNIDIAKKFSGVCIAIDKAVKVRKKSLLPSTALPPSSSK